MVGLGLNKAGKLHTVWLHGNTFSNVLGTPLADFNNARAHQGMASPSARLVV